MDERNYLVLMRTDEGRLDGDGLVGAEVLASGKVEAIAVYAGSSMEACADWLYQHGQPGRQYLVTSLACHLVEVSEGRAGGRILKIVRKKGQDHVEA